jgi:hypothetical protein
MLIIAYGLFGFGYVIAATFLVTSVRISAELRELEAWIWILCGFAAVPSVALWSWIAARMGTTMASALTCLEIRQRKFNRSSPRRRRPRANEVIE